MCGLAGVVLNERDGNPLRTVARMLAVLRHRGPDDEGTYVQATVALGFRRLSILDLSPAGHQPMSAANGLVTIIFNGEIYNFVELRKELESRGHSFRSTGDTEVLLHSYLEWGVECLSRLNGMWSFVIHDRRTNSLFGARDRFGIKPFYYHRSDGRFVFASEIKAIRASGLYEDRLNAVVASSFLVDGRLDETAETFYAGIRALPAGCSFVYSLGDGTYSESRYWDIAQAPTHAVNNITETFAELFEDAVRLHMRSDVPIGIHLSGGLDSTSIACAAARIRSAAGAEGPPFVFSYMPKEFDESQYIRATVEQTRARLIELKTSASDLWSDLETMLRFQDEPVHTLTALVSFQLMRATAAHGIRVVLNGQGGDETLAGYSNYFRNYWSVLLRNSGVSAMWREMKRFAEVHGGPGPMRLFADVLSRKMFYKLGEIPSYRAWALRRRAARIREGWFTPELVREVPQSYPFPPADLNGALAYAQRVDPLPLYLRLEDRNSMAFSIEARLPFLDYRVAELAFRLPDEWKLRGPWNKYVLRESMSGRIPENVRIRPDKMGFPVPAHTWFSENLFEPVMDLLTSRQAIESGRYRVETIERDMYRHRRGEADFSDALFSVAQFEIWSGQFGHGSAAMIGTKAATVDPVPVSQ